MHQVRSFWWKEISSSKWISDRDARCSVSCRQLRWPKICGHTHFRLGSYFNELSGFFPSFPFRDIQRGKSNCAVVLLSPFYAVRSKGDCIVIQSVHLRVPGESFLHQKRASWSKTEKIPHRAIPPWIDSVKLSITFMFLKVQCHSGTGRGVLHFYWMSYTFYPIYAAT